MVERHDADRAEGDINLGAARAAWQAEHIDAPTRALLDEDARWFLHQSLSTPCLNALEGAEGAWLTDLQGRRILDFHGNSVHQIGHGHARVVEAIKDCLDVLPFSPRRYTNRYAVELARRLCEAAPPPLGKLLLAPGGTAALGMALKLARVATGRHKTISMWDSFHGASLDAISVGGEAAFRRGIGPLLPGCEHAPPCDPDDCLFGCAGHCSARCADYVEYMLAKEGDVAAVIVETIRSTDVQIPPAEYYRRLRAACDRHGALLIFDEIPVALGRTGELFAFQRYDVVPDMLLLGKGLGGGIMPLAALIARGDLDVAAHIALGHYTHEKSPVACAAALATLDVLAEEDLLARSRRLGAAALARLQALVKRHPDMLASARGAGLLLAVEFAGPMALASQRAETLLYACLSQGLSFKIGQGRVVVLAPPLNIEEAELNTALDILDTAVAGLTLP